MGPDCWLGGVDCEVSSPAGVDRLADSARSLMGNVDVWINNAGYCAGFQVPSVPSNDSCCWDDLTCEPAGQSLEASLSCSNFSLCLWQAATQSDQVCRPPDVSAFRVLATWPASYSRTSPTLQGFLDTASEQLQQVVGTNMLVTLLCSRRACF